MFALIFASHPLHIHTARRSHRRDHAQRNDKQDGLRMPFAL